MSANRDPLSSYGYADELIDDIDDLIAVIAHSGRYRRLDFETMSIIELEAQYRIVLDAYSRHTAAVADIERPMDWRLRYRPFPGARDAATRSPFTGEDIGERSG